MVRLLGITGKARSGKDTVASCFMDNLPASMRYALADPIKDAFFAMMGANDMASKAELMRNKEKEIEGLGHSPRSILQAIGTEGLREGLDTDFWVKMLKKHIKQIEDVESELGNYEGLYPIYIVVPDVRFNNEAQFIKDQGGLLVQVVRPDVEKVREHKSEQGVSVKYVDYTIVNDGSLDDLKEKVQTIIEEGELHE